MRQDFKNILVSRTDHLGDVLLATPVVTALNRLFPKARVSFLVDPLCREVPLHHPGVTEVLEFSGRGKTVSLGKIRELAQILKSKGFDAAVLVYPDWRVALACWLAKIPLRVGTGYRLFSFLFNRTVYFHRSKGERRHEIEYNLELVKALISAPSAKQLEEPAPCFVLTAKEKAESKKWLKERGLWQKKLIAVHAGSFGSALNWDAAHYAKAAEALAKKYRATVVLTGTEKERPLAEQVRKGLSATSLNLAGFTDLKLLAGLFEHCLLFLGSSTGPLHLAAAMGTPSIGIYCPISVCGPWRWGPRGRHCRVILSAPYMDCPTCLKERCGYYNCMNLITVAQVLEDADSLLNDERIKF